MCVIPMISRCSREFGARGISPLFRFRAASWPRRWRALLVGHFGVAEVERLDGQGHDPGDEGRLTHLWSAGMMYQGAHLVLVALMASSYAFM